MSEILKQHGGSLRIVARDGTTIAAPLETTLMEKPFALPMSPEPEYGIDIGMAIDTFLLRRTAHELSKIVELTMEGFDSSAAVQSLAAHPYTRQIIGRYLTDLVTGNDYNTQHISAVIGFNTDRCGMLLAQDIAQYIERRDPCTRQKPMSVQCLNLEPGIISGQWQFASVAGAKHTLKKRRVLMVASVLNPDIMQDIGRCVQYIESSQFGGVTVMGVVAPFQLGCGPQLTRTLRKRLNMQSIVRLSIA